MILSNFTPEIFGSKLNEYELNTAQVLMKILVINIALTFPVGLMDSIVSAHEKFLFQRLVTLLSVIFNPLVCLPLLLIGYGSVAIVTVTTCITLVKLIVNIFYCKRILNVKFDYKYFDFEIMKEITSFSFFLFLNMIIDQINWSVDKYILGRVSGTAAVAIYGVGAHINSLFITFSTSISSVFAPRVNRIAAECSKNIDKRNTEFSHLLIKVGRIQYLLLMLIASGFVFFGEYFIVNVYSTAEYVDAYPVALLLMLPAIIPLIHNVGIEIQRSINKHKTRSIIYFIMALVNVIISIPLAMCFGPIGSALGTSIGLILVNGIVMNIYYKKGIGLDIPKFFHEIISLSKGLIIPVIAGIIMKITIPSPSLIVYLISILVFSIVYIISMWNFGMNESEKLIMKKPIRRIAFKVKG
jgi:O-antigen/teichoic acid export membrane protein